MFNVNLKFNYNIDERFDRRLIEEKLLLITSLKEKSPSSIRTTW